jgi:hypothetical protein
MTAGFYYGGIFAFPNGLGAGLYIDNYWKLVGWVEPFAKPIADEKQLMGIASLHPSYEHHPGHACSVIPGRAQREPGIHNHDREYGFRACAKRRIPE